MQDAIDRFLDVLRSAWRFRWKGFGVAVLVALAGWFVVLRMPPTYQATASVFVDTHSSLRPAIQNLAVEQDVNAQINYVRQSLLSGTALEEVAVKAGVLDASVTDPKERESALADMAARVKIDFATAGSEWSDQNIEGSVYSIAYKDSERSRALKVTDALLESLINNTLGGKKAGSEDAQAFLAEQIKDYEGRLREAEARLADFKKSNIGLMPTEQGDYFTQLQVELDAARKAESNLAIAMSRRNELERQLRGETVLNASAVASAGTGGTGGTDTLSRIKDAQARLDELLQRFTDKHPDVVAARATLEDLNQRRERELEALRRGDTSTAATSGITSNPVYQSVQLQLNQADVEIASLRSAVGQHQAKAADLRRRLDVAPKVEAQYAQLMRDYDINKEQYTALMANYEKVRLGAEADDAGTVRFRIMQRPSAPYAPSKRSLMLVAVLAAALGAGAGICYGMNLLWPVVTSKRDLAALTDLPVLGVVSAAFPHKLRAEARGQVLRYTLALMALFVAFAAIFTLDNIGLSS